MDAYAMKLVGSGAAEAIPNPMCRCTICENARKQGGKEIRSRSCFRVSKGVQIDFGPDQFYQSAVLGNDLTTITDLLITHTHSDHLALAELELRAMAVSGAETPVNLYASRAGCDWIQRVLSASGASGLLDQRLYRLQSLEYYRSISVAGLTVTPLKGNHKGNGEGELSVNYLIALESGKTLFYAVDTGYFFEETFEFLRNVQLDVLVVEGTFGDSPRFRDSKTDGHMGCAGVLAVTERLLKQGTLRADSRVVVTHINHKHTLTHARMQAFYDAQRVGVPIAVGYDGMEVLL
ncbi:MAG TPA: MBL fold metallo-hydrolase [Clostridia bacterium]|nr:MBL fold metallo-hydrolase [Clostridia bacterium]